MYTPSKPKATTLLVNQTDVGETITQKVRRILNNKEPISDGAPIIYTDRKDGVKPETDIRTDRWEHAIEAMDHVTSSNIAKRELRIGERTYDTMTDQQKQAFHEKFPNNKFAPKKPEEGGA